MTLFCPVVCEHANPPQCAVFSQRVERALITAYPFVTGDKPLSVLRYFLNNFKGKFLIMDSGVFTLMKDSAQGKGLTHKELIAYTDRYIKMVKAIDFKYPIIEVDAHYIGGLDILWDLRKRFIDAGLIRQLLPVWHEPERISGWERMVETFPRLSVSAREWESTKALKIINSLLFRARAEIPKKHVHILGTSTDVHMSRPDNFSCDATSWNTVVLFGETKLKGWPPVTFRGGKLSAPAHVLKAVDEDFNAMQNVYRQHPEARSGVRIRRPYIRAIAAGLYHTINYYEAARRKNASTDLSIIDPLDYAGKYHARN